MRKLLILLRSAGLAIEAEDISLEGFIDTTKYSRLTPEAFLEAIKQEDTNIAMRVKYEREQGNVPRYVASYDGETGQACVRLEYVPKVSELGSLAGTANKILITTSQRTPDPRVPHIIQSPGACVSKTAASVRADLLGLLPRTRLW